LRAIAVIPARYASTRFPGKPLCNLLGKPMIAWVVEGAGKAALIDAVCVATDHEGIADAARSAGAEVVMTSPDCASGTDRVAQAACEFDADVYVNVQGDEPAIDPRDLDRLVAAFDTPDAPEMATLARKSSDLSAIASVDVVKVVRGFNGDALYFSRSPIPHYRDCEGDGSALIHVGVYAFTREALLGFPKLPTGLLETAEKLEQLRALEAGWRIRVIDAVGLPAVGVDRPEDIEIAEKLLRERLAGQGV
jgi:3-deoxy-D-manno-octulosonate cytidylyltransferase